MRLSFLLGVIGGVILLLGVAINFVYFFDNSIIVISGSGYFLIFMFVGGVIGIIGGIFGKKMGGIIMIIGGIFALIDSNIYGMLGFLLLVITGVFALKEEASDVDDNIIRREENFADLLRNRYLNGETNHEEQERMRRDLQF